MIDPGSGLTWASKSTWTLTVAALDEPAAPAGFALAGREPVEGHFRGPSGTSARKSGDRGSNRLVSRCESFMNEINEAS